MFYIPKIHVTYRCDKLVAEQFNSELGCWSTYLLYSRTTLEQVVKEYLHTIAYSCMECSDLSAL